MDNMIFDNFFHRSNCRLKATVGSKRIGADMPSQERRTYHIVQNASFINGALDGIELRLKELAADPINYGDGSGIGDVDAFWTSADDRAILLVKLVVFFWALAVPDEK